MRSEGPLLLWWYISSSFNISSTHMWRLCGAYMCWRCHQMPSANGVCDANSSPLIRKIRRVFRVRPIAIVVYCSIRITKCVYDIIRWVDVNSAWGALWIKWYVQIPYDVIELVCKCMYVHMIMSVYVIMMKERTHLIVFLGRST